MFDFLRRLLLPIMVVLIVAFIGWLVLDVGMDLLGRRRGGMTTLVYAGAVNGENITWEVLNQAHQNLVNQEMQKSDRDITDARSKELEQSAWKQLVQERLLLQEAAKYHITVTDQEVFQYLQYAPPQFLQENPNFQTNGKFDYQKYTQLLADPQAAGFWNQLDPIIRLDLMKQKTILEAVQSVQVSDAEARQAFLDQQEKVKIGLVNIPYDKYNSAVVTPGEDEFHRYYDQQKDKYKVDDRVKLNLVMIEKKATEDDWQRILGTMQAIHDSIQAGSDFKLMAVTYSQDGSAKDSGDLGWSDAGRFVAEFDQRAFSMKEGEISQPFRSQFGWHILKHYGYRDEPVVGSDGKPTKATKKQAHVAHILIRVTPSQESLDAAFRKLQDFELVAKQKDFASAATEAGLEIKHTQPFAKKDNIPYIGRDQVVTDFCFASDLHAISPVMENNSSIYVLQLAEKIPAGIASYEEVRGQIALDLRNARLAAICRDTAAAIANAAHSGISLQNAAKAHGFEYTTSEPFSRESYVPYIGRDPRAVGAAFTLSSTGQIIGPVDYDQGAAVMTLLERVPADLSVYTEKRDSIVTAVRTTKQQEFYGRWMESLMNNAKVESNIGRAAEAERNG
jgi:peptidyl-prolyl cis-trans isomerase D